MINENNFSSRAHLTEFRRRLNLQRTLSKNNFFTSPVVTYSCSLFKRDSLPVEGPRYLSNSYTRNLYNWMISQLTGALTDAGGAVFEAGSLAMKDRLAATYSDANWPAHIAAFTSYRGTAGTVTQGLVVGSGDAAESFDAHALDVQIANGTGANQLNYMAQGNTSFAHDDLSDTFTISHHRNFERNGAASVFIKEIGFYFLLVRPGGNKSYMILRDLVDPVIEVEDAFILRLTYDFTFAMP